MTLKKFPKKMYSIKKKKKKNYENNKSLGIIIIMLAIGDFNDRAL